MSETIAVVSGNMELSQRLELCVLNGDADALERMFASGEATIETFLQAESKNVGEVLFDQAIQMKNTDKAAAIIRFLAARGMDLHRAIQDDEENDESNSQKTYPIYLAIDQDRADLIPVLVSAGVDVNRVYNDSVRPTALHHAAWYDRFQCYEALVASGADTQANNVEEHPASFYFGAGLKEEIQQNIWPSGGVIDRHSRAIITAIRTGDMVALGSLLDNGVSIDFTLKASYDKRYDDVPCVPLCHAIALKDSGLRHTALTFLIGRGAQVNINAPTQSGRIMTPLGYAAQRNQVETIEMLLKAGADINRRGAIGMSLGDHYHHATPLQCATWFDSREAYDTLIRAGADQTARDEDKKLALELWGGERAVQAARSGDESD